MLPRYGNFSIFQDGSRRYFGFFIFVFEIFNGGTAREGRTALLCQIWSKSVKPCPKWRFFIFQDGGRRHYSFLKF